MVISFRYIDCNILVTPSNTFHAHIFPKLLLGRFKVGSLMENHFSS